MKTKGAPVMGSPSIGSSVIIGPDGRLLTPKEHINEKLIIADLDLSQVVKTKTFADASGHCELFRAIARKYLHQIWLTGGVDSRPDLLWLGADPTIKAVLRVPGS
jgi:nitrilase